MLKQETFMNADEAIEKGFATNKANAMEMVAIYNKQTEAIMPEEQEKEEKSFMAHIKSFFAVDKAEEAMEEEEPKAMEEEEEKPSEEAMDEDPKEEAMDEEEEKEEEAKAESEVEALKAKIEQLEGELKAKHEAEFIAKKDLIFEAIADNKLTLSDGKGLFAESVEQVTAKLEGLESNATGYGKTRQEEIVAVVDHNSEYQALQGAEKTAYFSKHKEEILNKLKQES